MNPTAANSLSSSHHSPNDVARPSVRLKINGSVFEAIPEELLLELLNRTGTKIPQVCYHPQLGSIQTCDTCLVEANGTLVRACATRIESGMEVATNSAGAATAQRAAFDRILPQLGFGRALPFFELHRCFAHLRP